MAKLRKFLDRFGGASFPPAAALGAFTSFTAAFKQKTAVSRELPQSAPLVQIGLSTPAQVPSPLRLDLEYSRTFVLGGANSAQPLRRSLSGLVVGPGDRIFVLGDGELRTFESDGKMVRSWKAPEGASCFTVDPADRIYFGIAGRIEIYSSNGIHTTGFTAGFAADERGPTASITAIKVYGREILAADAGAKLIRRFDFSGNQLGLIGTHGKIRGFMLPNKSLDFDVDANGVIRAADSGRHRISSWKTDGSPVGRFGKWGLANPEDFVGCCNPVNLAILPDGKIVAAEKVITRVKVYSSEGKLLALIGPEYFDPKCVHLHLAVDSKGRILVADPIRREIQVFSAVSKVGVSKSV